MSWWKRVFLGGAANTSSSKGEPPRMLRKLSLSTAPAVTYAVGDIHGQLELYKALEARILEDARSYDGPVLIVLLGDLIDRGPKSAQLIDYLLEPPLQGVTRLCLRGNHEDMFLQVLRHPSIARDWISWGGAQTLSSYGIHPDQEGSYDFSSTGWRRNLAAKVPSSHRAFLQDTPICLSLPEWFFSHAGINAEKPLEDQSKDDLLWGNPGVLKDKVLPKCLIHGHVPVSSVEIFENVINVDTGAYMSGCLSAVRLVAGQEPVSLCVHAPEDVQQGSSVGKATE